MKMEGYLKFVPEAVNSNPTVFPMSNLRVGLMQNVKQIIIKKHYSDQIITENDLDVKIPIDQWPKPEYVSFPREGVASQKIIDRINDAVMPKQSNNIDFRPLYKMTVNGGWENLASILPVPGSNKYATTIDIPHTNDAIIVNCELGGINVCDISLMADKISLDHSFVVWTTGFDLRTKQIYPTTEQEWILKVSSDASHQNAEVVGKPHPVTIVPVRTPLANDAISITPQAIEADEGASLRSWPEQN